MLYIYQISSCRSCSKVGCCFLSLSLTLQNLAGEPLQGTLSKDFNLQFTEAPIIHVCSDSMPHATELTILLRTETVTFKLSHHVPLFYHPEK